MEELTKQIESAEVKLAQTHIRAPFDGRITSRTVDIGQTIGSADTMFRLASFSPLFADVFVSELDSRRVRAGQAAEIVLEGSDKPVVGRVVRVSPVVDDQTGTVKITAELRPASDNYRPGAFVRVRIETDTREQTTLIPKRAVIERDGETFVFVNEGETARARTWSWATKTATRWKFAPASGPATRSSSPAKASSKTATKRG